MLVALECLADALQQPALQGQPSLAACRLIVAHFAAKLAAPTAAAELRASCFLALPCMRAQRLSTPLCSSHQDGVRGRHLHAVQPAGPQRRCRRRPSRRRSAGGGHGAQGLRRGGGAQQGVNCMGSSPIGLWRLVGGKPWAGQPQGALHPPILALHAAVYQLLRTWTGRAAAQDTAATMFPLLGQLLQTLLMPQDRRCARCRNGCNGCKPCMQAPRAAAALPPPPGWPPPITRVFGRDDSEDLRPPLFH